MSRQTSPYLSDPLHRHFALDREVLVLGRAADCDLVIVDPRVSRHHAELRCAGDGFLVADLGSRNGTNLNDHLLSQPLPLRDGNVIQVGSAQFVYHDPEATLDTEQFPHLVLDQASGQVWVDRRPVSLSPQQYALLCLLWSRQGLPCSRDEIAEAVWPDCSEQVYDYQIESLVKRLRAKLEPNPAQPTLLLTVRGWGYRLVTQSIG